MGPPIPPLGGCNTDLHGQMETHGYYQHGEGFQTVNSKPALSPFSPNVPPALDRTYKLGTDCPGTYASEFGASAWSSFESVSPTLAPARASERVKSAGWAVATCTSLCECLLSEDTTDVLTEVGAREVVALAGRAARRPRGDGFGFDDLPHA